MGLDAEILTFLSPTVTGSQTVNMVGSFTPKVAIFLSTFATDVNGAFASARMLLGWAVSSTARGVEGFSIEDNVATANSGVGTSAVRCITLPNLTGTGDTLAADFTSFAAGQLTVNWSTVDGTARRITAILLSGTDLDVAAGSFNSGTVTGNVSVTGLTFQPKLDLFILSRAGTTNVNATSARISVGAAVNSTNRWGMSMSHDDGAATTDCAGVMRTASCILRQAPTSPFAVQLEADFVSQNSDGLTVNVTTAPGTNTRIQYLALGGSIQVRVNSFTQPTATGNQSTTGDGFSPTLELLFSHGKVVNSTVTANFALHAGAARASTERHSFSTFSLDAADPTQDDAYDHNSFLLTLLGTDGAVNAQADFVSMDSDGTTRNWSTADATAREVGRISIGAAAVAGGQPTMRRWGAVPHLPTGRPQVTVGVR